MKFYIIGIDDNQQQQFGTEPTAVIASHRVFSGGQRHHEIVRQYLPSGYQWINISVPLSKVFDEYKCYDEVVVFASGDPLFFGFANTVLREVPDAEICLFPYFNSLQLLAHRLLMPYQDMHIVSLTGRPWHKLDEALIIGYDKIGILTDNKEHTPAAIARRMLYYGYSNYRMSVGQLLGNKEKEQVTVVSLEDVGEQDFLFPNNIILEKVAARERPFGIPESEFNLLNGRAKMITKMPVRLLTLNMLDLRHKNVFWDVGFCTGSVSIEAKIQFPHLQIYAFEKREEGRELIDSNARRFGTPGIEAYIGDFMDIDLDGLPLPDAVFIGGHGGNMGGMVDRLAKYMKTGGTLVFNSVSAESREMFVSAVHSAHLLLEESISITIDDFNTIEVMKAVK